MDKQLNDEPRADWRMACCVATGVRLSRADGVTQALEFMVRSGVPRDIAVRVLSGPRFARDRDRSYGGAFSH
ncbi:hypothetical protein IP92_03746 [Pseudoduganella flava]|uniref:ANTAR domain-containing protein n=1 Tax=Pseudoduganella flava TaxID=871742 RepID=A0A562PLW4_9BURK|nr:hypothetical protein [Pseudoduganella flava]QGZ40950.1 hypothetical protein GO485_18990 [Pseudoduganella flava]TWI45368.1 hypothetical protein IP92_03746 [Pseudoduganella flava]